MRRPRQPEAPRQKRLASPLRGALAPFVVASAALHVGAFVSFYAAKDTAPDTTGSASLVGEGVGLDEIGTEAVAELRAESAPSGGLYTTTAMASPETTTTTTTTTTTPNTTPNTNTNTTTTATPNTTPTSPPPRRTPAKRRSRAAGAGPSSGGAPAEAARPLAFGAAGDRSAVALATAFTRHFPSAASTDPAWARAPLGDAGEAEVTLTLDDAGHLVGSRVGGHPSPVLLEGIRRTLALLRHRTFVAHGATTRLRLRAHVSPDVVHDGLHGDVFALGASVHGSEGQGFFALAVGRRIDVSVVEKP